MSLRTALLALFSVLLGVSVGAAQDAAKANPPNLASVNWAGAPASLSALEGKTVVVLTYVSWCPICNEWAPTMISQMKQASAGKPVVILAISTDTPNDKAGPFLEGKGLSGPNVLYGYAPGVAKEMGFTNQFWNFAVIGPDGQVARSGNAGSRYNNGDYTIRRELDSFTDWGEFSYVEPSQSAIVSQAAWALELGVTVSEAEVNQLRNKLSPGDKAALNEMLDRFVEKQSTKMKTLAAGTTKADKLAAADVAASLSTSFKTRPEGKEAKAVLAELKKDKDLKPEWLAKADFERASAMPNPAMRMQALASLAKKLPDTVYGGKAAAAIIASQATAGGE